MKILLGVLPKDFDVLKIDGLLHYSCLSDNLELVELLIKREPKLVFSTASDGKLAIHWVARDGNTQILNLLLETIHLVDENGWTPLHYAAANNRVEAVQFLLSKGAKPDVPDKRGHTPQYYAKQKDWIIPGL
uniref:Uncharacterized protein n=1 Tax=Arcella intermedia TaxID=1963864 RepID=A0A6B2LR69_9EUKA